MKTSVKSVLSLAASGVALLLVSQSASATCTPESYTGSICYTAATFCPQGYLDADGRVLQVRDYQALFSLLSNLYGGDGMTTFKLPNLQQRLPIGMGATLTQGTMRGNDTVTLKANQVPAPALTLNATADKGASDTPSTTNNQLAVANGPAAKIYAPKGGTQVPLAGLSATSAAGQEAVNIVPTQTVLRACIVANGIYPPRPY